MKTSAVMVAALDEAKAHGGTLVRWQGGFWTWPGCPAERDCGGYRVPAWYVGTQTVMALVERGLVEITERMHRGAPCAVRSL